MEGHEKTQAQALEDKKRFNRQVNFFVMREMWQVVRGPNADDTIYICFYINRKRYTQVIDTGIIRYKKGELVWLQALTGLRKEIFTGEARFECSYKSERGAQDKNNLITAEDWDALVQWRKQKVKSTKTGNTIQDRVCSLLSKADQRNVETWDFYQLCYFLRERKAAPHKLPSETIQEIETAIKKISFFLLDRSEVGQLKKLHALMKSKQSLLNAMIVYKNEKDTAKKEK